MNKWFLEHKILSGLAAAILVVITTVIVKYLDTSVATGIQTTPESQLAATSQNTDLSLKTKHDFVVSILELSTAISQAPPLQKKAVGHRYVGLTIDWTTQLGSATKNPDGTVFLVLSTDTPRRYSVVTVIQFADYPELGVLPEDSVVRIQGKISDVDTSYATIANATLNFTLPK